MMRILQIIPSLERAGAEKQLVLLATRLPRDEFDVHVCAVARGGPYHETLRESGVPTEIVGKRRRLDVAAYAKLERHVRRLRPDVVQTWLFGANAYGRAAALAAGVPAIICSEQCVDLEKSRGRLRIDRFLARRSSRIIVNAIGVRQFYERQGIPRSKFTLIPNGIDPHEPSDRSRPELLAELGLDPDTRLVGSVGRLWPQKRMRDVIEMCETLCLARDDVHTLVIGDGPERRMLAESRERAGLRGRVHFLGHRDDVPKILEHLDAFVLASGFEGSPNAVMEAMSAGVPVVATDIPGNRDLVQDGVTGFLVPVGDTAAMAQRVGRILDDPGLGARFGAAGRREVEQRYSVHRMVTAHAAVYRELMD